MRRVYSLIMWPFLLLCAGMAAMSCVEDNIGPDNQGKKYKSVLIENFESHTYRGWKIQGDAFSWNLASKETVDEWQFIGYEGQHIMHSITVGDAGTGTMTSPEFVLEKPYLNFLIAGGGDYSKVYVAVFIEGNEVRREAGSNSKTFKQISWDLKEYVGKTAQIKLVDESVIAWGFICADYFYMSESPAETDKVRTLTVDKKYMNFPISASAPLGTLLLVKDGEIIYDVDLRLTDSQPDYWVHMNCSDFIGEEVDIVLPFSQFLHQTAPVAFSKGLQSICMTDEPLEKAGFYNESLRPRVHFTSIRGWLNDPCGLYWYNGKWCFSYQHNPFGTDWGNIHWGRAVSSDLAHWTETDDILAPDEFGAMFSGYSIVDEHNLLQKEQTCKTLVSYYTAAGEYNYASRDKGFTTCMAYSTDGGETWIKYENNPVMEEKVFQNRDPHVFWSEDDGKYYMVIFLSGNTYGFFQSSDLVTWSECSRIDIPDDWECPDFMRMRVEETDEYKWVLMGVQNKYYVGDFSNGVFTPCTPLQKQDIGTSYLAAHTFSNAPDGRHVQIGCMGGSRFPSLPFDEVMGFPKELSLHQTSSGGYALYAEPVAEIASLYSSNSVEISNEKISSGEKIGINGVAIHFKGEFDLNGTTADSFGFDLDGVKVIYYPSSGNLSVSGGGLSRSYGANGVTAKNGRITIEAILDNGMVEAFAGDGQASATIFHLTGNVEKKASFVVSDGEVNVVSMKIVELNKFWE